jgi:hypothetical protein
MTESDIKHYEARKRKEIKHEKAISKARYRGEKSIEWHKNNKLSSSTLADFKKEMKKADKEWESLNNKPIS